MLKDPSTHWNGPFPYDALAPAGITPRSTRQAVLDASFELMARGRLSPEVRRAWDELRTVSRRLLVDFLLYPVDLEAEIATARDAVMAQLERWGEVPDPSPLLCFAAADLEAMERDTKPFAQEAVEARFPDGYQAFSPFPDDDFVEFDR